MPAPIRSAALAAALLTAAPAFAQETIGGDPNITLKYYEVSGRTYGEVQRDMQAKGPGQMIGKRRATGLTEARFNTTWMVDSAGGCDLSEARVDYEIVVHLPKLSEDPIPKKEVKDWWKVMIHNLTVHEMDHVKLALGYAREMEKALRGATCQTARAEFQRVMNAYQQANATYDQMTKHGTELPGQR